MNEKEFLQKIKEIKVIVPDEQFFLEYNSVVYSILKENQQLKEKLNCDLKWAFKYDELYQENKKLKEQLQQENKELKNLNRIYKEIISDDKENYKLLRSEIKQLENQQKEFIEWLENKSKEIIRDAGYHQRICLDILEKYKEIIGEEE